MAVALAGTTLLGAGLWHKHHRLAPAPSKPVTQNADALPAGVSETTLADIRKSLEKQEYHISFDEQKKKLQSPNRRNNIRAYYEPGKLTVQTRVDTTGQGFKVELVNEGVFADGKLLYTPEIGAKAEHHENKVQISHNAFTEEFINNEDGVRQNFIVANAPEGTRQLQVKMAAKGLKVEQGTGNELRFYSEAADGKTRNELVYSDLKCWDANKKPLNATLAYVDNRIQISVDVANAAYPVTIDPIIANGTPQNANKVLEVNQSTMWLGFSVSSAGDVNGDGYSDIVVGVFTYDNGQNDEGVVLIYNGKPEAPGATAKVATLNAISGASAGASVSIVGDLDGDGLDDIAVGAPNFDSGQTDEGALFVHYGDAATGTSFQKTWEGGVTNMKFGGSVSGAGDVNGDGLNDIIVGSTGKVNGLNIGAAFVILGAAKNANPGIPVELYAGGNSGFGAAVSGAGDINRDGYDDVIVGAPNGSKANTPNSGVVYIYLGSANGINPQNVTNVSSGLTNTHIGNSLSSEDTNGDGYSDIIVGANQASIGQNGEGAVYIWRGSASGIATDAVFHNLLQSDQADAGMGISVAGAGDVNGDGYGDIVVGSDKFDNGQNDEGRATVFYGSSIGCGSASKTNLEINYAGAYFGRSVGGNTDVNADGYGDVIVGAPFYSNGSSNEGGVWVFYGSRDSINTVSIFSTESNQLLAHMGAAVSGGGDLNGDGYGDFVVGIPEYTQSGAVNSGSCWAYFGNNGNHGNLWQNKRNNLRLYNSNLSSPMSYQQATSGSFGLGLIGTSFTGRNNGRLMWDFATPGQKFSCVAGNPKDYPITTSTKTDGGQLAFYSLPPYEFKELVAKPVGSSFRIRGRVKYELTTALTGQRYSPWRYSSKPIIYIQPLSVPEEAASEIFVPRQALENAERGKLVTVFPNPVADRLFIQSPNMDQVSSLQLIAANGTMAFTSAKPQSEVDVSRLASGSYILVINRKDGSKTSHRVLIRK